MPNICFVDLYVIELQLSLREDTSNVIAEFDYDTIGINIVYEATIFLSLVNIVSVKKQVLRLDYFGIITNLNHLTPGIQAHDPKFTLSFSIHFKVSKGNGLCNITNLYANFFAAHYLISFKVVVFLYPKFVQILHFTMEVNRVGKEFILWTQIRFLNFS